MVWHWTFELGDSSVSASTWHNSIEKNNETSILPQPVSSDHPIPYSQSLQVSRHQAFDIKNTVYDEG